MSTEMKVKVLDNAGKIYKQQCCISGYGANFSQSHYDRLLSVQGKWVTVDTKCLFDVLVNAICPKTGDIFHLTYYNAVKNDVRAGKAKCGYCSEIVEANTEICPHCKQEGYIKNFTYYLNFMKSPEK